MRSSLAARWFFLLFSGPYDPYLLIMADTEFEEFRQYFDSLPQHLKAPVTNYTWVFNQLLTYPDISPLF